MKIYLAPFVVDILFQVVLAFLGEHGLDILLTELVITCMHTLHQTMGAVLAARATRVTCLAEFLVTGFAT